MRYEEVETVLPKSFGKDASSATADKPSRESSKDSRRTVIERLRGSWRASRRKRMRKSRKAREEEALEAAGAEERDGAAEELRKADSNATEVRSNRAKDSSGGAEEREPSTELGGEGSASFREGSDAPDADLTENDDADALAPRLVKDFSVEVGDGADTIEVDPPSDIMVSPRSLHPMEADDEAVSTPRSVEDMSRAIVKSKGTAIVKREPVVVEDVDEQSAYENEQLALAGTTAKWAKQVSISIAGYKTSFQFSDPMNILAQKVNEALNVVGDAALVEHAQGLDEIGDKVAEERDYDVNPTKLFTYLQQRAWGLAAEQLKENPEDAKVWVYRKVQPAKAESAKDGCESRAIVVQSKALAVHDGSEEKLRWKLLPLHASIVLGAPPEIVMDIIKSYPAAARMPDERGSLPVHLAASRLDVDPEGEKVVLHLFGAYPDSIQMQDRKGRTPQELAKLARSRKEAEEARRLSSSENDGIEKTAEETEPEEEDDDCSVKSGISARFKMMMRKSKSTDTVDRRKKGKKKVKSDASVASLSKARSADAEEEMGPGFAFLKPSKSYEARVKSEKGGCLANQDDEEGSIYTTPATAQSDTDAAQTTAEDVAFPTVVTSGSFFTPPDEAPSATDEARSIPLPTSFSLAEDDVASVKSSASKASVKSNSSKASVKSALSKISVKSSGSKASKESSGSKSSNKSTSIKTEGPLSPVAEQPVESGKQEPTPQGPAATIEPTATEPVQEHNEALRMLLEKAAENAGRGGSDVTEYLIALEDEWVTDVEALRRLDGEALDTILPIVLSREVQRLMTHADSIDTKFLIEDTERGRWVRSDQVPERHGRSNSRRKGKKVKRSSRKSKRSGRSVPPIAEDHLFEDDDDDQTCYSIKTEAPPAPVQTHDNSKVMIHEAPTEVKEFQAEEEHVEPSEVDHELEMRKLRANLIADARKKFPTRESLEDAIRERQQEVERAVNSGFDVDKQTLSRAALADDEVRRLLPLRLILPSIHDLQEMIGVLQIHKENSLRNTNHKKALRLQKEIDELQQQLDLEKQYVLKRKLDMASKCITCGENFTPEVKMVGILKTKEFNCPNCRGGGLIASLMGNKSAEKEAEEKKVETTPEPTVEVAK